MRDLVQQDLAAVWSEVLQRGQRLAEDLQQAALHGLQRLPLCLLPLAATIRLLGQRLGCPLGPGQRRRGQRLAVLRLEVVVQHLLAVQQVRAGLAQVTQIDLQHETDTELVAFRRQAASCRPLQEPA